MYDNAYLDRQEVANQPYSVEQNLEKFDGKIDFLVYCIFSAFLQVAVRIC